jgi:hypothetical protein
VAVGSRRRRIGNRKGGHRNESGKDRGVEAHDWGFDEAASESFTG